MEIHQDFTSKRFTLVFESSGRRIPLDRQESKELEKRIEQAIIDDRQTN